MQEKILFLLCGVLIICPLALGAPCESCYYGSEESAYYNCLTLNCKAELTSPSVLFRKISSFDGDTAKCEQCNTNYMNKKYSEEEYYECVNNECQELILSKATALVIKAPNKLHKKSLVKATPCQFCGGTTSPYDCTYYYCKPEVIHKSVLISKNLNKVSASCSICSNYYRQEYNNCAYFYCKNEILEKYAEIFNVNLLEKGNNLDENTDSYGCAWCGEYYTGEALDNCITLYCKPQLYDISSFITPPIKTDSTLDTCADQCFYNYYYNGEDYDDCIAYLCTSELRKKYEIFMIKNPQEKTTNLARKIALPEYTCEECIELSPYTGSLYANDCAQQYCEENSLSQALNTIKSMDKGLELSDCSRSCYYDWLYNGLEYDDCFENYCNGALLSDPQSPIAPLSNLNTLLTCNEICASKFSGQDDLFLGCMWNNCKQELFAHLEKISKSLDPKLEFSQLNSCQKTSYYYNKGMITNEKFYDDAISTCKSVVVFNCMNNLKKRTSYYYNKGIITNERVYDGEIKACKSFLDFNCTDDLKKSSNYMMQKENLPIADSQKYDINTCVYYFNNEVSGYQYSHCKIFFMKIEAFKNSANKAKKQENNFTTLGACLGLLVLISGYFILKNKKKSIEKEPIHGESKTEYKALN